MAATRRSFFGFLFGAAAAVPALPKIVEAMGADPVRVREIYRGVTTVRTSLPSGYWRIFNQGTPLDKSKGPYLTLQNWAARFSEPGDVAEVFRSPNALLDDMIEDDWTGVDNDWLDDDDQD